MPKPFLTQLKRSAKKLGIVTGRNRHEAYMALKRFKINHLFDAVHTLDDTPPGKKKPHPYGLLQIAKKFGNDLCYLYIGDLPDDILAAVRASKKLNIQGCGFTAAALNPKHMRRQLFLSGASCVCSNAKQLQKIILPKYYPRNP